MNEYLRGYNACNRKWRENIKDKIEEYKRDVINLDTYPNFSEQELHREIIDILQDLLEEKGE